MINFLRPFMPWLATTVFSAILIFSNQNPQGAILRGYMMDVLTFFAYPITTTGNALDIWRENKNLRKLLVEMSLELASETECSAENHHLRQMLNFSSRHQYNLIPAEVIGFSSDAGVRGLIVNKGTRAGVSEDLAVIAIEGIIGKVLRTNPHTTVVQLMNDPNIGIAVRLKRNRENGIIHANDRTLLALDNIPISSTVLAGDTVITSGLGGVFPEGLLVGVVTKASPASNGWLWDVQVQPMVNFSNIEEVFIISRHDDVP